MRFAETGICLGGRFLGLLGGARWPALTGYPLTLEFTQTLMTASSSGILRPVLWSGCGGLEYHPENAPLFDVLLGQFGRRIHPADRRCPPCPARPTSRDGAT
ncbi:MAG: hypothetical protein U0232_03290 [Thermomicrobiales bacterium]